MSTVEAMLERLGMLFSEPIWLLAITLLYTLSFWLKAWAWRLYADRRLTWGTGMDGLFASLFVNHILPVKAGDLVRAGLAAKRSGLKWDEALHSVAALRSLDMLTLGTLASAGALTLGLHWSSRQYVVYTAAVALALLLALILYFTRKRGKPASFLGRHIGMVRNVMAGKRGWMILSLTAVSWVTEGFVLFGTAHILNVELSLLAAVWVTAMTVAGQVFHFTPGGLGTYESVMAFSLSAGLGMPLETALALAIATHGYKFAYSYAAGAILMARTAVTWREIRGWARLKGKRTAAADEGERKKAAP